MKNPIKYSLLIFVLMGLSITLQGQILNPLVDSIPMRDGKKLAADIYLPSGTGPFPVILIQTPYNRTFYRWWLPLGIGINPGSSDYAIVTVDWRGFYGSAGAFTLNANRGEDGYDVVQWIAGESWSDGKIGTWGPSALGRVQYLTARENPPNLVCSVPLVAASQYNYLEYYPGGVYRREYVEQLDALGFGVSTTLLAHPTYDFLWQVVEDDNMYPNEIRVPMLMIGGWYDHAVDVMIELFDSLRLYSDPAVRDQHRLLMGPWAHGGHGTAAVGTANQGELNYPGAAGWNDSLALRFFDYHLRGQANGWDTEPFVHYFQPGEDVWYNGPSWPPATQVYPLYLGGNGALQSASPGITDSVTIRYDPRDPSPTVGGPTLRLDQLQGPYDISDSVEVRNDIRIFDFPVTHPDGLALKGKAKVILHVSSDRTDTDFAIRVTDVFPGGGSYLILDGIRRMRFRNGFTSESLITPGQVYEVEINLPNTSYTWAQGHTFRVVISSSNYPRFDANPNSGQTQYVPGDTFIAQNRVYFGGGYPSRIELPLLSSPIGVDDPVSETQFELFPNPARESCRVRWGDDQSSGQPEINVYDTGGRLRLQIPRDPYAATHSAELPTRGLAPGIYLVSLQETGKRPVFRRLLIAR